LGEIRQRGGKRVIAFYGKSEFDIAKLASNTFEIASGRPAAGDAKPFRKLTGSRVV
jgi:predicted NUDIX family NTP pyrophosphohydrolase